MWMNEGPATAGLFCELYVLRYRFKVLPSSLTRNAQSITLLQGCITAILETGFI